jgi:hypothetical protein
LTRDPSHWLVAQLVRRRRPLAPVRARRSSFVRDVERKSDFQRKSQ